MKEKNYVTSVRQDSNDIGDAPFKFQLTIELLTALLSGKVLLRNDGDSERTQILWCEYLNSKPYFFVNGWGSAFGSAMDRVVGIIETNGAGWRIDLQSVSDSSTEADKPLQNSPVVKEDWISVKDGLPEESGRYWCYIKELTDLGFSHFQWNCFYDAIKERFSDSTLTNGENVTHWMPLPAPPIETNIIKP